jgi:predicted nucleotide-binding protein
MPPKKDPPETQPAESPPPTDEEGRRGRKAGAVYFPRNSLNEALKVTQVIWEKNAGNPFPLLDIASKLGNSPTSSTYRELIRSAQRYGLTNETFSNDLNQTISLTELGNSIVAPTPDDDVNALKRRALETPEVFQKIFEALNGKIIPPPDVFKNLLMRNYKVLKEHVDACYDAFMQNVRELGLSDDIQGKVYLRIDKLGIAAIQPTEVEGPEEEGVKSPVEVKTPPPSTIPLAEKLPKYIFVAHGKNKKPLEQVVKILDDYKISKVVATDEANRGRPIGEKVAEEMKRCSAGIFIFTADEKSLDETGKESWRPSMNVVYELGAGSVLYGRRIVIFREEGVDFASDFRDFGYITFEKNKLDAKGLDLLKELGALEIIKFTVS